MGCGHIEELAQHMPNASSAERNAIFAEILAEYNRVKAYLRAKELLDS